MISLLMILGAFSPTLLLFVGALVLIYFYFKHTYSYWKKWDVPHVPAEIPFGNLKQFILQKTSVAGVVTDIYNKYKNSGARFVGLFFFWKPNVLLIDPDLVKTVMSKEFSSFASRTLHADTKNDPLTGHLVNLNGDEWKFMRKKLTPTFTSGKMKMMFQTITACSKNIQDVLKEHFETGEPLEVKDTMGRFTTDIIASCAFGIECDSLKNPNNLFRQHGKKVFETTLFEFFKILFVNNFPRLSSKFGLKRVRKETNDFFMKLIKDTVSYREKEGVSRKDFLDLLIQMKTDEDMLNGENISHETGKLTIEQIAAQSFVFFLAGFETSSTTLSSIMYELSVHQDIQDKTREEIKEVLKKHNGELTYEAIMEMKYLEQVIDESMRIHTVVPLLGRKCTQDFKFSESNYTIKKGMIAFIPVKGFHENPD